MSLESQSQLVVGVGDSGGGASSFSPGGSGVNADWGNIKNKPLVLTPPDYNASSIQSAEALTAGHVSTALSHTPGLAGGIRTESEGIRSGGSETDTALVTEAAIRSALGEESADTEALAREVVQTRQEIAALDTAAARKATALNTGTNVVFDGTLSDGTVSLEDVLSVTQVTLGEQADGQNDAVRADRTVEIQGTTNQVLVDSQSTTQGALTDDVSVTVEAPQNLHPDADFGVSTIRAGTSDVPNAGGGYYTGPIGHPDFIAETQNWRITAPGNADFREIYADTLRVEAFIAEVEEALAGKDFLTKSFGKLDEPFTVGTDTTITVQDLDGLGATQVFSDGDTIRLRVIDRSNGGLTVGDVWLSVSNYTDNGDGTQTWDVSTIDVDSGVSGEVVDEGAIALDYGVSGDYLIERSVLGPESGTAPYDRIVEWDDDGQGDDLPRNFTVLNLRGNLSSLPKAEGSGPGVYSEQARFTEDIIVGSLDESGSYLKYDPTDGLTIVTSDNGDLDSTISSIEATANENESNIELLAKKIVQERESIAGVRYRAGKNFARVEAQAAVIGDDGLFSESTLSLQASQNEDDIGTNATAIADLEAIVGDGTGYSEATLTLQASQNEDDTSTNATAIADLEAVVGDGEGFSKADLTLQAAQNEDDASTNSSAIASLEAKVDDDGNDTLDQSVSSITAAANENAATIELAAKYNENESALTLEADASGSEITLDAQKTIVDGSVTVNEVNFDPGAVTIRADSEPSQRPSGDPLEEGDVWIDTDDGDKPYTYDGSDFVQAYTSINGGNLETGTVDTSKITIADTLTLQPGGSFFAGAGTERFAFGDFALDRQDKGEQSFSIGAEIIGTDSGSDTSARGSRSEDYSSGDWMASHRAEYDVETSGDASATVRIYIEALDSSGAVIASNSESASTSSAQGGSGSDSGMVEVSLMLPSGTNTVEFYVSATTNVIGDFANGSAEIGTEANGNDTVTNVATSTDFFGPDGATWRSGGNVQIEINGRGNSSSQTSQAGEIYARNGLTQGSDLRYKADVERVQDALSIVSDLRGLTYEMDGVRRGGVAAQDLLGTYDEAVRGSKEEGYGVDYNALFAPIIEAIKTLAKEVDQLRSKVNDLQ